MTHIGEPDGGNSIKDVAAARSRAAGLLVAAAHLLDETHATVDGPAQLACLAAAEALGAGPVSSTRGTAQLSAGPSAQSCIRQALTALGELPAAEFADARTRDGARHARLALQRLS